MSGFLEVSRLEARCDEKSSGWRDGRGEERGDGRCLLRYVRGCSIVGARTGAWQAAKGGTIPSTRNEEFLELEVGWDGMGFYARSICWNEDDGRRRAWLHTPSLLHVASRFMHVYH